MRLMRETVSICFVTLIALLYVHQQVELVKLSYSIGSKEKKIEEMLDRKERLCYAIKNLESPSRLERVLTAQKIDIAFPKKDHVFNETKIISNPKEQQNNVIGLERKINISGILDFFSPRAEAQTK